MNSTLPHETDAPDRLVAAVQELSLARDLATIMRIVREAARELTGADGATFVLREEETCHYADEDAIAPLWKGRRFPLSACVSGWVMTHGEPAVVEDVFDDPRVPAEVYRPTFVKSLAMVPIRESAPIGAIGNYWARPHRATPEELRLLQTLANAASVAMENVELHAGLERRVRSRTRELELANRELDSFAHSISHDLQAPLSTILGYASLLAEDYGRCLPPEGREHLDRIQEAVRRMTGMMRDLLKLSRLPSAALEKTRVDLSALAAEILARLAAADPARRVAVEIRRGGTAPADAPLIRVVLEHLLGNAWKFTSRTAEARIAFGFSDNDTGREFFVRDNGAGFDETRARRLFSPFQRLHPPEEFGGAGIGLATVRRIVAKHGGEVRATGATGRGATFYFTLPAA